VFGPEACKEHYNNNMQIVQKRTSQHVPIHFDDLIKHEFNDIKIVPVGLRPGKNVDWKAGPDYSQLQDLAQTLISI
jgi:hypothetical protein